MPNTDTHSSQPTPLRDLLTATRYAMSAERFRREAENFMAQADAVQPDPQHGPLLAEQHATGLRDRYRALSAFCDELADEATVLAQHYAAWSETPDRMRQLHKAVLT